MVAGLKRRDSTQYLNVPANVPVANRNRPQTTPR